jgi:hypothetical protein
MKKKSNKVLKNIRKNEREKDDVHKEKRNEENRKYINIRRKGEAKN